jgi:hypothetical protein
MQRASLILVLMLGLACTPSSQPAPERVELSEAKQAEPEQPEPESVRDGFFMAEGAPDPRACTVAADCTANTIPDLDNPCCQNPRILEPYARAYWAWLHQWRRENCSDVTCPPPPAPYKPRQCAIEVDCVDGRCVNACP